MKTKYPGTKLSSSHFEALLREFKVLEPLEESDS